MSHQSSSCVPGWWYRLYTGPGLLFVLVVFLVTPLPAVLAAGETIYVDAHATGDNTGTSWDHAYTSLQSALADARNGDEIWVADGVYTPVVGVSNDRSRSFYLKNGVAIYGGFSGWDGGPTPGSAETMLDQRNADPATNNTILSGDLKGDDGSGFVGNGDNSYHVLRAIELNSTAILNGFTIRGGNANGNGNDNRGGGMYVDKSNLVLANTIFTGNTATFEGGGMYNKNSSPRLTSVTFSGNAADHGGGMANIIMSNPRLISVTFTGNAARYTGGGMHNVLSNPLMTNALFVGNATDGSGGGLYNFSASKSVMTNAVFFGNEAAIDGGAIYDYTDESRSTLRNSILWGNTSAASDPAQQQMVAASAFVLKSIIQDGSGTGDPLFVRLPSPGPDGRFSDDPNTPAVDERADNDNGDLRLLPGSPAIDAGSNAVLDASIDLAGNQRVVNGTVDIGVYESRGFTLAHAGGGDERALIATAFPNPLVVQVTSPASEPVAGGIITFTGPADDAGIDGMRTTAVIDVNGLASASVTANLAGGTYSVEAGGAGITSTVGFTLENTLPSLSIDDVTVDENAGRATFNVNLTPVSAVDARVTWSLADDTALAGEDYGAVPARTLVIPAGASTGTITVIIVNDQLNEPEEAFTVNLSNPVYAVLARDQGRGTIRDGDPVEAGPVEGDDPTRVYLPLVIRSS